jgi:RNA polymerase sigma-32 factor
MAKSTRIVSIPASGGEAGLNRYLSEIKKFPILAPEEEYMLAKRWREHGDTDAAAKLVNSHLRLVAKIAMGYRGYGLPVSELISEGNIGLMQGVKKFEPERGFRLATYAMWWIRASIQEFILRSWSLVKMGTTAAQKKLFFNLRRMKNQIDAFEEGDLKPADVTKIATDLGVTEAEVVSMNRRMAMGGDTSRSTPRCATTDGEGQWQDFLVDTGPLQDEIIADDEEAPGPPRPAGRGAGQPQRPREAHPDRAAADRRAQDARGAEPGLRRQPRAHPPDRGARVREAAGGADPPGRRAAAAAGCAAWSALRRASLIAAATRSSTICFSDGTSRLSSMSTEMMRPLAVARILTRPAAGSALHLDLVEPFLSLHQPRLGILGHLQDLVEIRHHALRCSSRVKPVSSASGKASNAALTTGESSTLRFNSASAACSCSRSVG